jgi:hypothetical protein
LFLFAEGLFIRDETEVNIQDSNVPAPKEQSQKAYREILLNELTTGLAEFKRPTLGLLLSSLSGGLDVSFSLLLMAAMRARVEEVAPEAVTELLVAKMKPNRPRKRLRRGRRRAGRWELVDRFTNGLGLDHDRQPKLFAKLASFIRKLIPLVEHVLPLHQPHNFADGLA